MHCVASANARRPVQKKQVPRGSAEKMRADFGLIMCTWFFFFSSFEGGNKTLSRDRMCLAISWSSAQHVFRYGGRAIVCRRTFLLLTLCPLAMQLMFSQKLQFLFVFFPAKNNRVYLGLLMTLNLNERFWLCKGLCAVLSLVFFFF